jgi:glycosyltransferase involved in cell wall biosynthesis
VHEAQAVLSYARLRGRGPVRVVLLLHTIAYGGVETLVINWVRSLEPSRIEATAVCFADPDQAERPFMEAAERAGLRIRTIPWGRRKPVFHAARELTRILRELDTEVLHTHNTYAELVGWLAARWTGVKVMTTQYVWADFGWKRNVQQWISAHLIRRFDLVTSQCEATLRDTIRRGVPAEMQRVLISGIEPLKKLPEQPTRRAIRARYGCSDADIVLVNVARFYPEKAQDRLLRWFARIAERRPQAKLWIMGVGPLEASLRSWVAELGLAERVAFLGFIADTSPALLAADIQVHTSRAEGIPLAICAGMAAGIPVVTTAVGGIPEIVRHEQSGLLVADGDGEAFVRGVMRLVDDEALRNTLGAGALRLVHSEYSMARAADALASMYEELVW